MPLIIIICILFIVSSISKKSLKIVKTIDKLTVTGLYVIEKKWSNLIH